MAEDGKDEEVGDRGTCRETILEATPRMAAREAGLAHAVPEGADPALPEVVTTALHLAQALAQVYPFSLPKSPPQDH